MQIPHTFGLLMAANEQCRGFIKLRGAQPNPVVRLMAAAGRVGATFTRGELGAFAAVNRILDPPAVGPVPPQLMTASQEAVVAKWKARLGPRWPTPLTP